FHKNGCVVYIPHVLDHALDYTLDHAPLAPLPFALNGAPIYTKKHENPTDPQNNISKPQNDKSPTDNFLQAVAQIRNTGELQNNITDNSHPTTLE
ncbi:20166_t:CDS:2, partial [Racocetra fulgida]